MTADPTTPTRQAPDLDVIRRDVENARYADFHFDTDDLVGTDAVTAVIERHAPWLLAEVEHLRAQPAAHEIRLGVSEHPTCGYAVTVSCVCGWAGPLMLDDDAARAEYDAHMPRTQPTTPDDGPLRVVPEHFHEAAADAWNSVAIVYDLTIDQTDDRLRAAVVAVLRLVDADRPTTPDDVYQQAATVLVETLCALRPGAMTYLTLLNEGDALGKAVRAAVDAGREDLTRENASLKVAQEVAICSLERLGAELERADREQAATDRRYMEAQTQRDEARADLEIARADRAARTLERDRLVDTLNTERAEVGDLRRRLQAVDLDWSKLKSERDEWEGIAHRHARDRDAAEAERDEARAQLAAVRQQAEAWATEDVATVKTTIADLNVHGALHDLLARYAGEEILRLLDTGNNTTHTNSGQ